ncbi:MAG: hypothetical protein H7Z75_01190 [Ferruginibacter sp.]|nr:hypothetical protein [Cytophagales bacterium]
MEKIDPRKDLKPFYNPSAKVVSVEEIPSVNFPMIDGSGNSNASPKYAGAIERPGTLAYALKFQIERGTTRVDYAVKPLKNLWWADDTSQLEREPGNGPW